MSIIESLIEQFEKGKTPKELIKEGYKKSTVYEAYRRYKAREEAKKTPVVQVFKRLEEGKTLPKIVIETGLDPDEVKKIYEKWLELKKIDINQPAVLNDIKKLKEAINTIVDRFNKLVKSIHVQKLKLLLAYYRIVKCPTCNIVFPIPVITGIGATVSCPRGHKFNLQKSYIIVE